MEEVDDIGTLIVADLRARCRDAGLRVSGRWFIECHIFMPKKAFDYGKTEIYKIIKQQLVILY